MNTLIIGDTRGIKLTKEQIDGLRTAYPDNCNGLSDWSITAAYAIDANKLELIYNRSGTSSDIPLILRVARLIQEIKNEQD